MAKIDLDLLKELHSQGKSNREIGKELKVHHNTISYHLHKNNLQCNTANQAIDMVSETEAKCKKCKDVFPLKEFQFGRKGQKYEYRFSFCNSCRRKQTRLNLNSDIKKFLCNRYAQTKTRCKKENITFSISKDDFIVQYYNQNGKCFYTEEDMVCNVGSGKNRKALSVDKIVPDLGYIAGNTIFCTNQINTCKSDLSLIEIEKWMPPIYKKIANYLGAKDRIEIGSKVKVSDIIRSKVLGITDNTIFIVEKILPNEKTYIGSSKRYYTDVYVRDIRDLKNLNAMILPPISEPDMVYLWQLLED